MNVKPFDLDRMCAEAMERLTDWIEQAAEAQLRGMAWRRGP